MFSFLLKKIFYFKDAQLCFGVFRSNKKIVNFFNLFEVKP